MLLIIREIQLKTSMRYHLTAVRMAVIKISTNKCWQGCGDRGSFLHRWWECRLLQPLWKAVWKYLQKLKVDLPFDPPIPLLAVYPKEPKTLIWMNMSTHPYVHCSIIYDTKIWKQPKCPSVDEWIKQLWDIYAMEYYSALKKKILPFATVWMDLGDIMLSDISQ